jgi:hypothetical protein
MGIWGRTMTVTIAGVCIALLAAGCSVHPAPAPELSDGEALTTVQQLDDAPEPVREADPAADCGVFELGQSAALPPTAIDCLRDATAEGEAGALGWTSPTAEGDPIVHFALIDAGSTEVTVHVSTYFDRYGSPGWDRSSCPLDDLSAFGCIVP